MDYIFKWDARIFEYINGRRSNFFNQLMPRISILGGARFSILTCIFLLWLTWGTSKLGFDTSLAMAESHLMVQVIKRLVTRLRPYLSLSDVQLGNVAILKDYSFPSGHTTAAFSMATVMALNVPVIAPVVLLLAATVGFSRIYVGMHYPTDVVMGALIGIISAVLV